MGKCCNPASLSGRVMSFIFNFLKSLCFSNFVNLVLGGGVGHRIHGRHHGGHFGHGRALLKGEKMK